MANRGRTSRPIVSSNHSARTGHYGLGWNVGHDASGRLVLNHSGAFSLGAAMCVALVPGEKLGIVVLTNGAPCGIPEAIAFSFMDLAHAGKTERDWFATVTPGFEELAKPNYGTRVDYKKVPADRLLPLPAASYAGTYHNDFVGNVVVGEEGGKLVL